MSKKLTPAMVDLLLAMRNGVRLHYMGFTRWSDAYYFRTDTHKACTKQAQGLLDRGLIFHPDPRFNRLPLELTDLGKTIEAAA